LSGALVCPTYIAAASEATAPIFKGEWEGKSSLGAYYLFSFKSTTNGIGGICKTDLFSEQRETWQIVGATVAGKKMRGWLEPPFGTNFTISVRFTCSMERQKCKVTIRFSDGGEDVVLHQVQKSVRPKKVP
jgi:hypothetical protein